MRALVRNGGPLSVRRLAHETRITPNGVRDALRSLEWSGVVDTLGSGRTRLFLAPPENPIVAALEALFEAERRRFDEILETIAAAAKRPEVVACWLFGSVARAEDAIESDVDVAVVIDAPRPAASRIADSVREQLLADGRRLAFSPSVVSLTPQEIRKLKDERSPLWTDLVRDSRVLLGPPPDRLERPRSGRPGAIGIEAWKVRRECVPDTRSEKQVVMAGGKSVTRTGTVKAVDHLYAAGRLRKAVAFHDATGLLADGLPVVAAPDIVTANAILAAIAYTDALTAAYGRRVNQKDHARRGQTPTRRAQKVPPGGSGTPSDAIARPKG